MTAPSASPPSLPEAEDFRAECQALYDLLAGAGPGVWAEPTAFKGWTPYDVVGHLHMFDKAVEVALTSPEDFAAITAGYRETAEAGGSTTEYTRGWLGNPTGPDLLERWRQNADAVADLFRDFDPRHRVPWGRGPGMSARSSISARQMETWAHGQAVFDLMGRERAETDRIRNITVLCVNTYEWAFRNRGLALPAEPPFVSLASPSGAVWTWNDQGSAASVRGTAVAFCQVMAQTRNVADTTLAAEGVAAQAWMPIAQCFAGAPHDPPPPGLRVRQTLSG